MVECRMFAQVTARVSRPAAVADQYIRHDGEQDEICCCEGEQDAECPDWAVVVPRYRTECRTGSDERQTNRLWKVLLTPEVMVAADETLGQL